MGLFINFFGIKLICDHFITSILLIINLAPKMETDLNNTVRSKFALTKTNEILKGEVAYLQDELKKKGEKLEKKDKIISQLREELERISFDVKAMDQAMSVFGDMTIYDVYHMAIEKLKKDKKTEKLRSSVEASIRLFQEEKVNY